MAKLILGYWKMRGLGERIRLMLEYMGLEYEEVKYPIGTPPVFDNSEWMKVKYTLGLDFPNLPYIIDGELKMTESWAIMRYLAKKNNNQLYPEPGEQEIRCDVSMGVVHDFRTKFTLMIYNTDFKTMKEDYLKELHSKFELFDKFIGNKKWLAGEKLTFVDFALAETLARHQMVYPGCLDKFDRLKKYYEEFQNLEAIKAYHNSDRFNMYPLHLPYAQFGHCP